jgi:hypothetical protein
VGLRVGLGTGASNLVPPPGIKPRYIGRPPLILVTIPAELSWLLGVSMCFRNNRLHTVARQLQFHGS